jgi:hypothetical protein
MSEGNITAWQALFDEYNRIVRGVGEILRDADRLLAQRGFESAHAQNTFGTEGSAHMDLPEKWTPGWFARFYKDGTRPTVVPYVAVFLHDRGGTEDFPKKGTRLREPVVVAGVIRSATEAPCRWVYWHAKRWFWSAGTTNGPAVASSFADGNKDGQAQDQSFGVSLERISGLAELEQVVVEPLMKLVEVG